MTVNLSVHPSTAFAAAQDEEDHEQDDVYFRVKLTTGEVIFRRKGRNGTKGDLKRGGFSIKLYKLGQTDGRGKDVGPGGGGVLPQNTYTGMCRPTGS